MDAVSLSPMSNLHDGRTRGALPFVPVSTTLDMFQGRSNFQQLNRKLHFLLISYFGCQVDGLDHRILCSFFFTLACNGVCKEDE